MPESLIQRGSERLLGIKLHGFLSRFQGVRVLEYSLLLWRNVRIIVTLNKCNTGNNLMHTAVRYEEAEFSSSLKKGTVAVMQISYRKHAFCIYLFILLCKKNPCIM